MINLQDIYYYMNLALLSKNFIYLEEEQRRLLDFELKNYLKRKINDYNPQALSEYNNLSVFELIKYIASLNNTYDYFKDIQQVIHFILGQMNGIIWWQNDEAPENDYPLLDLEKKELYTHPNNDITQVFDYVYNTYQEGLDNIKLNRNNK
ncbi:MAG: hypothetical protein J6B98_01590 [Bacilli bacterium]|nr:hypothetical protein [Bacilli bacterium]